MILVTVGTTMPFDLLLEEVDRLAGLGVFTEPVLCQSGRSVYRMSHAEQFVGRPGLDDLIEQSSMVITHGGATVIQVLAAGKPFVAFANPLGAGDHQTSFLAALAQACPISWSRDVRDLERMYRERRELGAAAVAATIPKAGALVGQAVAEGKARGSAPGPRWG